MIVIQNWMFLNISCRATFTYLSKKTENIVFILSEIKLNFILRYEHLMLGNLLFNNEKHKNVFFIWIKYWINNN